jgi:cytochrome c biogenesis protein CcmG, thiol:disulfide interchange protein DsbE
VAPESSSGKPNLWVLGIGFLLIVPVIAILASGFGNDPRAVPSMLEEKPAPAFSLVDLEGQQVSLESLRGQPLVLNFWSTWCLPCKQEHPLLQQAQRDNPNIRFLGVLYSDKPEPARRYLKKVGAAYPTLVDENNRVAIDYGVAGVPETFFVDRKGQILAKWVGPLSWPTLQSKLQLLEDS